MKISFDTSSLEPTFWITVVGVTKQNEDGTDRQSVIGKLNVGDRLQLKRERENQYDPYAIAVMTNSGKKIGYVPAGDSRLANHMDMGGPVSASVAQVSGGPGVLGLIFSSLRKNYRCVIEVTKHDFDWKQVRPYMDKSRAIEKMIKSTDALPSTEAGKAINQYREIVRQIKELDSCGPIAASWRRVRYPIDRLSFLLENAGDLRGAYEEIVQYEHFRDVYGLTAGARRQVASRKERLLKALGKESIDGNE